MTHENDASEPLTATPARRTLLGCGGCAGLWREGWPFLL